MKRPFLLCMLLTGVLLVTTTAQAAMVTLILKSGRKIQGDLISQDTIRVKISVGGIPYTYYRDEIERIDDGITPSGPVDLDKLVDKSLRAVESIPPVKVELIQRYMGINGTRESIAKIFAQIIKEAPPESVESFNQIFKVDEVLLRLVPIYDKYYTEEELRQFIEFYGTVAAQKMITVTPEIMQQAMTVSAQYFKERIPQNSPAGVPNVIKK